MGGPWFAVLRSGDDWHELDRIWISNGSSSVKASVQVRVWLEETGNDE